MNQWLKEGTLPDQFWITPLSEMNNTSALSCVLDDVPSIWSSFIPWIATATAIARINPSNIHVHHVCPLKSEVADICAQLGVQTHAIAPFNKANPYCNKITQYMTDFGQIENIVLTDVDIAFAARVPFDSILNNVAGKTVDLGNPSLEVMHQVFNLAGVKPLGICTNQYLVADTAHTFDSFIGNFNGGLYIISVDQVEEIGRRWAHWATWLIANVAVLGRWHIHVDQVAFCLAISELKLTPNILDNRWNFPTHIKLSPSTEPPFLLHHHARLNAEQEVIADGSTSLLSAVERVNSCIRAFRLLMDHNKQ